jgi:hypothetical protein
MAAGGPTPSDFTLTLTEDERRELLNFLEVAFRDKLVEERRTDNPDYRKHLVHEEDVMRSVIDKLRRR